MKKIHIYDKVLSPIVTEKSTNLSDQNKIVFKVPKKSKENIYKSTRNIPNVKVTDINQFSAYDLVKFKKLVFTETSIKELEKRYS